MPRPSRSSFATLLAAVTGAALLLGLTGPTPTASADVRQGASADVRQSASADVRQGASADVRQGAATAAVPASSLWRYGRAYPNGLPAAATNTTAYAAPALMDVGAAAPWVVTGTPDGWVHVRRAEDGSTVRDLYTGAGGVQASPVVVDWDRDGRPDILAANLRGDLVVWNTDGRELLRTLVFTDNFPTHVRGIFATPAVADLDGDGWAEIVVTSWDHHLYVLGHNGAVRRSVFLKDTSWASPAVADLDGNGTLEIVAAWDCDANSTQFDCAYGNPGGFVGVFTPDLALRWKQFMPGQVPWSSPAIGDVRGDGRPSIVLATGQMPCMLYTGAAGPCGTGSAIDTRAGGRRVYGFDGATGAPLPGWPAVLPEKTMSSPALADVDGDGRLETFVGTAGRVYRIDSNGAVRWGAGTCVALQKAPCGYSPLPKTDASPIVGDLLGGGRQVVAIPYDFKVSFLDAASGATITTTEPARATYEISQALGNGITATTWGGRTHLYSAIMLCRTDCYGGAPVWDSATLAVDAGPAGSRLLWPTFRGGMARLGLPTPSYAPLGAIGAYWSAHAAADGPLGSPTSAEYAVAGGRAQDFRGGKVFWGPTTGAHGVIGAVLGAYLSAGGPAAFGLPTSEEGPGGPAGSRTSAFQAARIWWSPATGAQPVQGAVLERYLALGAATGPLGLPVSGEGPGEAPASRMSVFQGGRIYYGATSGAHEMYGGILEHYLRVGGPVRFGLPTSGEHDREGGRAVDTQYGRQYWTLAGGATSVQGGILQEYDAAGGAATYGLPVADEQRDASTGTPFSRFTAGEIHWSATTGAHGVRGAVLGRWRSLGGPTSVLGLPVTDERASTAAGGRVSLFERGEVQWSAATGAWEVMGAIRDRWLASGGARGALGLPVSGEYSVPGGRRSDFVRGAITWSSTTGVTSVVPR